MSTYKRLTKHPITGKFETATWIDDYFGRHRYGVEFPRDGMIFKADDYKWETKDTSEEELVNNQSNTEKCCEICKAVKMVITRPLVKGGGYPEIYCKDSSCKCHFPTQEKCGACEDEIRNGSMGQTKLHTCYERSAKEWVNAKQEPYYNYGIEAAKCFFGLHEYFITPKFRGTLECFRCGKRKTGLKHY